MKFIVKVFVLSFFIIHIFGSQYELTVHELDEKYKSENWECHYKYDLTTKYHSIQFQKKIADSQIKQDSVDSKKNKVECSKPFALGFIHKEREPESSLYVRFMNRQIPLGSYEAQLLYDQFQKDEKYYVLQFVLNGQKVPSIERCILPKCVPENQLNENKDMVDNGKMINDYWAQIKQIAFLSDENIDNVPKIKFFTNVASGIQLETAEIYNKWDTIDNKLNLQITMHCSYKEKESAFELSEAAVEECGKFISDIQEHKYNESKSKSLYFSINEIPYKFEIDTHQISSIKKYYEEYYKDKKNNSSMVGTPTKVPVENAKNTENNLKSGIPAALFLEMPNGYQIEGSNCALSKQNGNRIIIVGSGKSDIFVSLTAEDELAILSISEPFYLLVNNGSYFINKVDRKILKKSDKENENNTEIKINQKDQIPKEVQEILEPIESNFSKLNSFKNLVILGAGGISCIMIISIIIYLCKK